MSDGKFVIQPTTDITDAYCALCEVSLFIYVNVLIIIIHLALCICILAVLRYSVCSNKAVKPFPVSVVLGRRYLTVESARRLI